MKIIDNNVGPITNLEVLRYLQRAKQLDQIEIENDHDRIRVAKLENQLTQYLKSTPAATQTREAIASFKSATQGTAPKAGAAEEPALRTIKTENAEASCGAPAVSGSNFLLSKKEYLQIINLQPATPVELHLVLDDCEERFTEDALEELRALVEEQLAVSQAVADNNEGA